MKFKTHEERMLHPEARLIPQSIWKDYGFFGHELPDELLPLMQAKNHDMMPQLQQASYSDFGIGKSRTWLAIALSHTDLSPEALVEISQKLNMNFELVFKAASTIGRLDVLSYLEKKTPSKLDATIEAEDYYPFRHAAENGHLDVLRYLEEKAPLLLDATIKAENYYAFRHAAENGHLDVLRYLEEKAPLLLDAMTGARSYGAFQLAAQNGHLDVLCHLEEKAPKMIDAMIKATNYSAFISAAENGRLDVLRHLEEIAPTMIDAMIKAANYSAFISAAENGHLGVLRHLEEIAPTMIDDMIKTNNYAPFRRAAQKGHLGILRHLEEKAPTMIGDMIKADASEAFRFATKIGRLDILRYLEEKAPTMIDSMIEAGNYFAFRIPAEMGYLQVLRHLEEIAPLKFDAMSKVFDYHAFRYAVKNNHLEVVDYLLSHANVFAYAEPHSGEYSALVNPFVTQKINALRAQKAALEEENPNAVFDIIEASDAKLLFYVLRNLIRRNQPDLQDDLLFLLNIPAVKALVHTVVSQGQENELLRLALTMNNQGAASLLLNIPAVRELAERNHYYRDEAQGRLDLRALAQNRESSMTALSQGEKERLQDALDRYQPMMIGKRRIKKIMSDLRATLESRYEKKPAKYIDSNGVTHPLPLQWHSFQRLGLQGREFQSALEAYAKDPNHTAWRYLSKPNPWMHEHASYVSVNPNNHAEKWSTFEEYQPEICLYYLGALDKDVPPTEGYTLETRLDGFIQELALIGRAHNWDNQRYKINSAGDTEMDDDGAPIMEEYDDLDKDRPSCFSGVKRRLFQSVRGHPLLTMLTKDILDEEIRGFVRQHIKDTVNVSNRLLINTAWNKILEGEELLPKDLQALRQLDIPPKKQDQWITSLSDKYGRQFTAEPTFAQYIKAAFTYKGQDDAHVLNFGHVHPEDLFEAPPVEAPPAGPGHAGFFDERPESQSNNRKEESQSPVPRG